MKQTPTRNIVLILSVTALCAALVGCSSSGDGDSGELEQQLDMAQAALATAEDARMMAETERDAAVEAQMTAEGERDAAVEAQMMAEQAAIDTRVNLAVAEKVRDAAAYGAETLNRVGDITVISKRDGWDSPINVTGWRSQLQTRNAGTRYTSMSQSYRDGSQGWLMPWYEEDGSITLSFGAGVAHRPLQRDPDLWTWRAGNTSVDDPEGLTLTYGEIADHGLGAAWQGFELTQTYDEGGTLTMRGFTDVASTDRPSNPYTAWPGGDPAYPNVDLDDSPASDIPAGWEGKWIYTGNGDPADGPRGSVDGVPGTFSCAEGDNYYCGLEVARHHLAPGYTADVAGDPVVFTPDDGSGPITLPHPAPVDVPSVNYLSFGTWLFVPDDITDLEAYDFGVLASGDDPFMVDNLQGVAGTADYAGPAAGTYADATQATLDTFEAKVRLTADFGTADEFGNIVGRVYDFEIASGVTSPLTELDLHTASWRGGGATNIFQTYDGGPPFPGGWIDGDAWVDEGGKRWVGSWGGKFFGNGVTTTDIPASGIETPSAFGGTFGATDGDRTFAGSFGARRQ